ncbi:protease inhibitor I42 family protein [Rhodocytophaga rosea]|uniref:Protease inhibitor I42 family protein n=1 Tax=Rhodocytophaga rosea TaxID=2704465 RepID=A0A6C0GSE2_9BACT|nr:protease inhibitor I42 family protein [Rhodocytophaga rosea]QHT71035.1 protease inhibitor I42 family protein [Rhodocytophaga rosea]
MLSQAILPHNSTQGIALSIGDATTISLKSSLYPGCIWMYDVSKNGVVEVEKVYSGSDLFSHPGNKQDDIFQIRALDTGIVRIKFRQVPVWDIEMPSFKPMVVEAYVA